MTRQRIGSCGASWAVLGVFWCVALAACNPLSPTDRAEQLCGVNLEQGCWTACQRQQTPRGDGVIQAGRVCE